ncbi:MAG: 1-(5-phosphoribosyl)-5-[(5-phosphoribosylamino)methylideneamino]imidazole-4-carboxamide isomerase [Lysobacter sp.]|nr:MAG: 1-(5-phosphoribosyl)-5-[(5-phosphoribosylamino)methylideneamino]imidazole-4-carboxamide isomerase [Lysobacter sp.]
MSFELYPALDIRGGRVVRLRQGDYAQETSYRDEPLDHALRYDDAGARWLHLVDLDAARTGGYALIGLIGRIRSQTGLRVQTGGGVRSAEDVERLLAAGAERVVIGSLAVREPARVIGWLERFGAEHITIALDARERDGQWCLPTEGWTRTDAARLEPLLVRYRDAGLHHLLCTDIDRDGMLAGPNIALYARLCTLAPTVRIQASGGAREAADVLSARRAGCAGIVLGKALLDGRFTLEDARSALSGAAPC